MRVAALYDVHGMRTALEAVLADLGDVDAIVFGGDIFAGPLPRETYELMRDVEALHVRGNAEREPNEWLEANLDAEAIKWGRSWPMTVELDGVLYCHATPRDDMPILTDASPIERFAEALLGVDAPLVVAGHTHMQFREERWANAGSIGMPYEDDVAAFWAIVSDGEVEFKRTQFDVGRAIAEIEATDWPAAQDFVRENLLVAPSRKEATEYFESLA